MNPTLSMPSMQECTRRDTAYNCCFRHILRIVVLVRTSCRIVAAALPVVQPVATVSRRDLNLKLWFHVSLIPREIKVLEVP